MAMWVLPSASMQFPISLAQVCYAICFLAFFDNAACLLLGWQVYAILEALDKRFLTMLLVFPWQVYAILEALNKRRGRFDKRDVLAMQALGHRVSGRGRG